MLHEDAAASAFQAEASCRVAMALNPSGLALVASTAEACQVVAAGIPSDLVRRTVVVEACHRIAIADTAAAVIGY